jgi:hypothetical protein
MLIVVVFTTVQLKIPVKMEDFYVIKHPPLILCIDEREKDKLFWKGIF